MKFNLFFRTFEPYTTNIKDVKSQKVITKLWETKDFGNVSLIVEGKELRAHKELLGLWSKYFKAMFESGMKESNESKIIIEGETYEEFSMILGICYEPLKTGFDDSDTINIYRISDKYQFDQLKEHCESFVLRLEYNWEMILELLKIPLSPKLKLHCQNWIVNNLKTLLAREDFNLLDKELIISILKLHYKKYSF